MQQNTKTNCKHQQSTCKQSIITNEIHVFTTQQPIVLSSMAQKIFSQYLFSCTKHNKWTIHGTLRKCIGQIVHNLYLIVLFCCFYCLFSHLPSSHWSQLFVIRNLAMVIKDQCWSVLKHLFCCCWFIVCCWSGCFRGFVFNTCFVMQYLVFFLVLQSSRWGRERVVAFCSVAVSVLCLFLAVPWVSLWLWHFRVALKLICFLEFCCIWINVKDRLDNSIIYVI